MNQEAYQHGAQKSYWLPNSECGWWHNWRSKKKTPSYTITSSCFPIAPSKKGWILAASTVIVDYCWCISLWLENLVNHNYQPPIVTRDSPFWSTNSPSTSWIDHCPAAQIHRLPALEQWPPPRYLRSPRGSSDQMRSAGTESTLGTWNLGTLEIANLKDSRFSRLINDGEPWLVMVTWWFMNGEWWTIMANNAANDGWWRLLLIN